MTAISSYWTDFVEALRREIEAYGELLRLIEEQKDTILQRDPQLLTACCDAIEQHVQSMQPVSEHRKSLQAKHTSGEGEPDVATLIRQAPSDMRPMLEALHDEIRGLLERSRSRLQRNQMMMSRARELTDQLQKAVFPGTETAPVYGTRGNLRKRQSVSGSQYTALS